jgi:hypothetical protein
MFWNRKKKRALVAADKLEQERVATPEEVLAEIHAESENAQRLRALLTDIRKLQERTNAKKPVKRAKSTRKRKSSSRK